MKIFKQVALFLILVSLHQRCLGINDTNIIALSAWSDAVSCSGDGLAYYGSVRGRLLVCYGHSPAYGGELPETQVYLELQNVSTALVGPLEIYFDPQNGLQCELLDIHNQPPPATGGGGSGAFPSTCWITLPYDATMRLRVSWYGYGMLQKEGLKLPLYHELVIRAGNTNNYFLSGTFTVSDPTNHITPPGHHVWQGKLILPKTLIAVERP
jgi:hypothetical protein